MGSGVTCYATVATWLSDSEFFSWPITQLSAEALDHDETMTKRQLGTSDLEYCFSVYQPHGFGQDN